MLGSEWIETRWEAIEAVANDDRVVLVRDRLDPSRRRVLKRARSGPEIQALDRELDQLLALNHPSIRRPCAVANAPGELVALLEHVEGVDLAAHLRAAPEDALRCLIDLLRALVHLHQAGRVHGDLKPANVLVDDRGDLHLIDLSLTGLAGKPPRGGTRPFMPPESERGHPLSLAGDRDPLSVDEAV